MHPPVEPPPSVVAAARARASARADRDFATADRLRGEIEAAGWKVIDAGVDFRLEPAHPADTTADGVTRFGRSAAVPSRLGEPPDRAATVLVVSREDPGAASRAVDAMLASAPAGTQLVLVVDGPAAEPERPTPVDGDELELVRTSAVLGQGAALNAGLRRSRGRVVVLLDGSVEAEGDVVGPLVAALEDPAVAIAGPVGLVSADLRHFRETEHGPATAIEGYLQAFRRSDAIERGPFDEGFRFYRNLDIWWSLVLRDEGEGTTPRAAVAVPGLPLERGEPRAWATTPAADRDRLSKRNFYRVLDRFRTRTDLAVAAPMPR